MIKLKTNLNRYILMLFLGACFFVSGILFAENFEKDISSGANKNAVLVISKMRTLLQSETGRLFNNVLPNLIQTSLQGTNFNWLKVTTDTSSFGIANKYELNGDIEEYGDMFRLDLQLFSNSDGGSREKLLSKTYQIVTDSILVQVNRLSRELGSVILRSVKNPESNQGLKVILFPFTCDINDASTSNMIDYLTSSVKLNLESIPIINKVDIPEAEAGGTSSNEKFQRRRSRPSRSNSFSRDSRIVGPSPDL